MTGIHGRAALVYALGIAALLPLLARGPLAQKPSGGGKHTEEPGQATPGGPQANSRSAQATLANLAWLEGRWQGNWGPRTAEETWMAPKAGVITGLFREIENDKTLVIELFSLVENVRRNRISLSALYPVPRAVGRFRPDGAETRRR